MTDTPAESSPQPASSGSASSGSASSGSASSGSASSGSASSGSASSEPASLDLCSPDLASPTTFSAAAWAATAETREAIEALPFLRGLGDGSLDRDRFGYYLAQDAHYLETYARALAAAAVKAETVDDLAFFAGSARDSILVERDLHRRHVGDIARHPPSPTCLAYTSYLLGVAHTQGYPELVAALLPCYWIYSDVGTRLLERAGMLQDHPYADWIGMYADESFATATATARAIADRVAASADDATRRRMHLAFARAATYEWMFWDAAWRLETWPT